MKPRYTMLPRCRCTASVGSASGVRAPAACHSPGPPDAGRCRWSSPAGGYGGSGQTEGDQKRREPPRLDHRFLRRPEEGVQGTSECNGLKATVYRFDTHPHTQSYVCEINSWGFRGFLYDSYKHSVHCVSLNHENTLSRDSSGGSSAPVTEWLIHLCDCKGNCEIDQDSCIND